MSPRSRRRQSLHIMQPALNVLNRSRSAPQTAPATSLLTESTWYSARPQHACIFTSSQGSADVVYFYVRGNDGILPRVHRRPGALWVYSYLESPAHAADQARGLVRGIGVLVDSMQEELFLETANRDLNVLMTYDAKSDIFFPYGNIVRRSTAMVPVFRLFPRIEIDYFISHLRIAAHFESRTKDIVIVMWNCYSHYRNRRILELLKHIKVFPMRGNACI